MGVVGCGVASGVLRTVRSSCRSVFRHAGESVSGPVSVPAERLREHPARVSVEWCVRQLRGAGEEAGAAAGQKRMPGCGGGVEGRSKKIHRLRGAGGGFDVPFRE